MGPHFDQMFAMAAVNLGYLDQARAAHALAWRRNNPDAPDLASLCIAHGVLTAIQAQLVTELVRRRMLDPESGTRPPTGRHQRPEGASGRLPRQEGRLGPVSGPGTGLGGGASGAGGGSEYPARSSGRIPNPERPTGRLDGQSGRIARPEAGSSRLVRQDPGPDGSSGRREAAAMEGSSRGPANFSAPPASGERVDATGRHGNFARAPGDVAGGFAPRSPGDGSFARAPGEAPRGPTDSGGRRPETNPRGDTSHRRQPETGAPPPRETGRVPSAARPTADLGPPREEASPMTGRLRPETNPPPPRMTGRQHPETHPRSNTDRTPRVQDKATDIGVPVIALPDPTETVNMPPPPEAWRLALTAACVVGAGRALPGLGLVSADLLRVAGVFQEAADPRLTEAAGVAFAELPADERHQLDSWARAVNGLNGPSRDAEARRLTEKLESHFLSAPALREAMGNVKLESAGAGLFGGPEIEMVVESGKDEGKRFRFPAGECVLLGRAKSVKLRLEDPAVSRRHCLIEPRLPSCRLKNLSMHGTLLNGAPLRLEEAQELRNGDLLQVGNTSLRFLLHGAPSAKALADAQTLEPDRPPPPPKDEDDSQAEEPSISFPGLTVLEVLGEGGQGVVYKAQRSSGELVALKTLRPDREPSEAEVARFLREATLGSQIDHPAAVQIRGSGFSAGVFYFEMEYVDGPDLSRELARRGKPFKIGKAISIIRRVLGAVGMAHRRGLVHRDIKPQNILLQRHGRGYLPKLSDFGLMRSFESAGLTFTATREGKGTPAFMPPEQVEHARLCGPPADVYGLAATLYFMITGEVALALGELVHPLLDLLEGRRIPLRDRLPDAPPKLDELLTRAMAIEVETRPPNVDALDAELAAIAEALEPAE